LNPHSHAALHTLISNPLTLIHPALISIARRSGGGVAARPAGRVSHRAVGEVHGRGHGADVQQQGPRRGRWVLVLGWDWGWGWQSRWWVRLSVSYHFPSSLEASPSGVPPPFLTTAGPTDAPTTPKAGMVLDSPFSRLTDLMSEIVKDTGLPIPKVGRLIAPCAAGHQLCCSFLSSFVSLVWLYWG